ncbi:MFS transporter [Aspergillus nomiae NRRL 13137]|uniref:MFS transporter n=1 Tax=Aspergillus nomiae NRRL (strain ATCC 15546 / NRRL 13137 / CBS 260.88 / M93) TaxID=1509407 RepID=A0A0L1JGY1_ASPN3|nr:MFS transporter [Aspergillus nomiae NRRL 13137]KNG91011.1 MFS transporter [Aspergillus nomiae NRRL 13137]
MEAYFQRKRIERAVVLELAQGERQCSCNGEHGSSCHVAVHPTFIDKDSSDDAIILVHWTPLDAHLNPANYSTAKKVVLTAFVSLIGVSVTAASAIDACGLPQYTAEFQVREVVGSLATGLFMIGLAFGSLLSGPFSETFGRNVVYIMTMFLYLLFIMAAALAPNPASHLVFRFLAGVLKGYSFFIYAIPSFGGPVIGQLIGSFIPPALGWRWLEWIMLIMGGIVLVVVILFQPETYGDLLLYRKAKALRKQTGDVRYRAPMEVNKLPLQKRLITAVSRPFLWSYTEPIVLLMALYLTIVYIILFTFLEGYKFIFGETYGLSQGLTSITWAGMFVGMVLTCLIVPTVYTWTRKEYERTNRILPETRLWYAMLGGALAVPVGLFWMGWTSYSSISIWSPLIASAFVGFGMTTIFTSAYLYVIDSYGVYSASALGFMAFIRYLVSGGVMIAGSTIYERYGVHYTLTVLGAISAAMASIPYLFYFYGARIRQFSKHAVIKE